MNSNQTETLKKILPRNRLVGRHGERVKMPRSHHTVEEILSVTVSEMPDGDLPSQPTYDSREAYESTKLVTPDAD